MRDLRSDSDNEGKREVVVEPAHEALLRRWPALVDWLDADENALKATGSVSRAAETWAQNNHDDEYIIHVGERLRFAERLLEREDFARRLQGAGSDYLQRCRAVEDERAQQEKRQRRRLRVLLVIAGTFAIGLSVTVGLAYRASEDAIIATAARDETFLDVLGKSGIFRLEETIDKGGVAGDIIIAPEAEGRWTTLVDGLTRSEGNTETKNFIVARPFGKRTPGRILASGHESLNFANAPFTKTALIWLQGDGENVIGVLRGHNETISKYPNHEGILIVEAMVSDLKSIGYDIRYIDDLGDDGSLSDISVLIVGNAWGSFSDREINAAEGFVRSGHGLFASGLGWSWLGYGPHRGTEKGDLDDYPMNHLMRPYGIRWGRAEVMPRTPRR